MTHNTHGQIPSPDPVLKEQAILNALRLFRQQDYGAKPPRDSAIGALLGQWKPFAAGAIAASLALGIFFMHVTPPPANTIAAARNADDLALLQQMKDLFGDKLAAVVRDGGHIEPVLAASSAYTDSQPVVITLREGNQEMRVISFSGNTVTLPFHNEQLKLSATVTDDGAVIVDGKGFVWMPGRTVGTTPAAIEARTLGTPL